MRLIDADKVKRAFIGNRYGTKAIEYVIDDAPTVKAIPIDWIEKKAQEFLMNRNFRWATDFQEVVDMWKVENNIPLFDNELKITLGKKENDRD